MMNGTSKLADAPSVDANYARDVLIERFGQTSVNRVCVNNAKLALQDVSIDTFEQKVYALDLSGITAEHARKVQELLANEMRFAADDVEDEVRRQRFMRSCGEGPTVGLSTIGVLDTMLNRADETGGTIITNFGHIVIHGWNTGLCSISYAVCENVLTVSKKKDFKNVLMKRLLGDAINNMVSNLRKTDPFEFTIEMRLNLQEGFFKEQAMMKLQALDPTLIPKIKYVGDVKEAA